MSMVLRDSAIRDPQHRFNGLPITTAYIDGRTWKLERDVYYQTEGGLISTVRAGFLFDWASVPRFFWRLVPPAGMRGAPYGVAALFHDWLYVHQAIEGLRIERREADAIFLEIMLYVGVPAWLARVLYRAVRAGGWWGWQRSKAALAKNARGCPRTDAPESGPLSRREADGHLCTSGKGLCTRKNHGTDTTEEIRCT